MECAEAVHARDRLSREPSPVDLDDVRPVVRMHDVGETSSPPVPRGIGRSFRRPSGLRKRNTPSWMTTTALVCVLDEGTVALFGFPQGTLRLHAGIQPPCLLQVVKGDLRHLIGEQETARRTPAGSGPSTSSVTFVERGERNSSSSAPISRAYESICSSSWRSFRTCPTSQLATCVPPTVMLAPPSHRPPLQARLHDGAFGVSAADDGVGVHAVGQALFGLADDAFAQVAEVAGGSDGTAVGVGDDGCNARGVREGRPASAGVPRR